MDRERYILQLRESGETYLETILLLKQKNSFVRSIDVAQELGYSKPSISRAMSILKQNGYIEVEDSGNIILTETGRERAENIYERHKIISEYFEITLGTDKSVAEDNACRVEHVIDDELFSKIKEFVAKK